MSPRYMQIFEAAAGDDGTVSLAELQDELVDMARWKNVFSFVGLTHLIVQQIFTAPTKSTLANTAVEKANNFQGYNK